MKYQRDKRRKKWPGEFKGRAGEKIQVTFDPQFWDREVEVGDRRTVLVTLGPEYKAKNFVLQGFTPDDAHFDLCLGEIEEENYAARTLSGYGPLVHGAVLATYQVTDPTKLQVEIHVTDVLGRVPPFDPYAETPGDET